MNYACQDCEILSICLSRGKLGHIKTGARIEIIQCVYCHEYMTIVRAYLGLEGKTGWGQHRSSVTSKEIPICLRERDCSRPTMIAAYSCFPCSQKDSVRESFL